MPTSVLNNITTPLDDGDTRHGQWELIDDDYITVSANSDTNCTISVYQSHSLDFTNNDHTDVFNYITGTPLFFEIQRKGKYMLLKVENNTGINQSFLRVYTHFKNSSGVLSENIDIELSQIDGNIVAMSNALGAGLTDLANLDIPMSNLETKLSVIDADLSNIETRLTYGNVGNITDGLQVISFGRNATGTFQPHAITATGFVRQQIAEFSTAIKGQREASESLPVVLASDLIATVRQETEGLTSNVLVNLSNASTLLHTGPVKLVAVHWVNDSQTMSHLGIYDSDNASNVSTATAPTFSLWNRSSMSSTININGPYGLVLNDGLVVKATKSYDFATDTAPGAGDFNASILYVAL